MTESLPGLFGVKGEFVPLSDDVLTRLPDKVVEKYQAVADAFTALAVIENKCEAATRELHETVAEMREVEAKAANNRITHTQLVKDWIRDQRAG